MATRWTLIYLNLMTIKLLTYRSSLHKMKQTLRYKQQSHYFIIKKNQMNVLYFGSFSDSTYFSKQIIAPFFLLVYSLVINQTKIRMSNNELFNYSITTLPLVQQDIEKRNYYFKKTFELLDRKADMDLNYSAILEAAINKQYHRVVNQTIPTQHLYARIVEYCLEDCKRVRKIGKRLKHQSSIMQSIYEKDNPQQKKILILGQSLSKEISFQREKIEKIYNKFQKKNRDLQQTKIQYLCAYLSNQQLQKKNQLYLQVNNLDQTTKPLREEYATMSRRYNDMVEVNTDHLKSILTKVEAIEAKKINLMKDAVRSYLQIQKDSLDETLRNNPFRRASVDSLNEAKDLNHHTDQIIDLQKVSFLFPSTSQYEFVDSIYSRIQVKKNLQQIILYGQSKQHKKQLSSLFNQQECDVKVALSNSTKRMVQIFKSMFEGQPNLNMYGQLRQILKNNENMRKDFTLCLQKYRINSEFQLRRENKQSILKCLNVFLDVCNQQYDTYNSKMIMVLSLTYYFMQGKKKRELQQLISKHPIWKRIGWWKAALLESIFEETRVKLKKQEVPITIWDIKAGGVSRKGEGQQLTHQHICFNQVLYYVRNMALFHIPHPQILLFALQNIAMLKFTQKSAKDIIDLCQNPSSLQQSVIMEA